MHAVEKDRREVEPFLIGEKSVGNVVAAKIIDPRRPPIGEAPALLRIGDADKAQIENAVL